MYLLIACHIIFSRLTTRRVCLGNGTEENGGIPALWGERSDYRVAENGGRFDDGEKAPRAAVVT